MRKMQALKPRLSSNVSAYERLKAKFEGEG